MSFECKYDQHEDLGKGMFGVVKKCRDKETGQVFAAKIIRKTAKTKKDVQREISMMKLLKHERLAQIYESFETARQMIIVMEFIPGKELFAKVTEEEVFSEKTAVLYLKQILLGIQHMHAKHIVHLDIKPENIICKPGNQPGSEDVKLIDFGLAREILPGNDVSVLCGTPEFVAPEILSYDPVSTASDMWSIGVVTYVLLSGISPFLGDTDAETLAYVTSGEFDFDDQDEIFDDVSEDAKSFIEELLIVCPRSRNSVDDCLRHRWIINGGGENLLNTSNLKNFNAKRKWAKTLKAVKAVGRFAFLSKVKKLSANIKEISEIKEDIPVEKEELVKSQFDESTNNEYLHLPEIPTNDHLSSEVLTTEESLNSTEITTGESLNSTELTTEESLNSTELSSNISSKSKQLPSDTSSESKELGFDEYSKPAELQSKKSENLDKIPVDETFTFDSIECNETLKVNSEKETSYNIMEANNNELFSNHNGEEVNGIADDEEAKDNLSPLDSNGVMENGDVDGANVKVAFKNWYRRASTSKTLTSGQQKNLNDIPIVYGEVEDGGSPKPETNGEPPKQPEISEEEQKILEAISRRLSITPNEPFSNINDPKGTKPKISNIRRGSVPQARLLKGNVKNRMLAFENK